MHRPNMTHVTLPNLRSFLFQAVSVYLEAVLSRITAPCLKTFHIGYLNQLTFSVPRLLQFMERTENLRFGRTKFEFDSEQVYAEVSTLFSLPPGMEDPTLATTIFSRHITMPRSGSMYRTDHI